MGLDELRGGILEKAREKARAVAREQEAEVAKLLSEAEHQRKQALDAARAEASQIASEERRELIANAHLEAKREMAKARDEFVASVTDDVRKDFVKSVRGRHYGETLRKLVEKAKRELGGEVVVHVSKEDRKHLADMKGVHATEKAIECEGGAIVVSHDGRVRVDATLEAIFAEREDKVRQEIYRTMLKK